MHLLIPVLARDIDNERQAAAVRSAVARQMAAAGRPRPSSARRRLAMGLAAISRTSAGAVRRLDECLADDLITKLASSR